MIQYVHRLIFNSLSADEQVVYSGFLEAFNSKQLPVAAGKKGFSTFMEIARNWPLSLQCKNINYLKYFNLRHTVL